MEKEVRYQVVKGESPVGDEHFLLRDAVLMAASYGGHAATFTRDKHGFKCFFASRQPIPFPEYVPAPCDAFRPWSPLQDEGEAEEAVAKEILEIGRLHFKHRDMGIVTLTYENGRLAHVSGNAPVVIQSRLDGC